MNKEDVIILIGKRVRIFLKDGIGYTGYILSVNDQTLTFIDKYDATVLIDLTSVNSILEVRA